MSPAELAAWTPWFDHLSIPARRHGALLYAERGEELWAVTQIEPSYPANPEMEAYELVGQYGSLAGGIGDLVLQAGSTLPPSLHHWSTVRDVPADRLGGWTPALLTLDGDMQLGLSRSFEQLRFFGTTVRGVHLAVLAPGTVRVPHLRHHPELAPPSTPEVG